MDAGECSIQGSTARKNVLGEATAFVTVHKPFVSQTLVEMLDQLIRLLDASMRQYMPGLPCKTILKLLPEPDDTFNSPSSVGRFAAAANGE